MRAHADLRHQQFKKMCAALWFFAILCLLHCHVQGVTLEKNGNNNTRVSNRDKAFEVPDRFLLIMNEMNESETPPSSILLRHSQGRQNSSSTSSSSDNRRCVCQLGVCKCCTGIILDLLNQKACMRVTYHPGDFAFDVAMSLNNRILYENSLSGKNPRPICISPPRINNLKVCAKFYNVFFPGRNFHFCLMMTGHWRSLELFNFTFDCLRMGANGIAMVKPYENGGLPVPNPLGGVDAVVDAGEDDIEDYDENVVKSLLDELFER